MMTQLGSLASRMDVFEETCKMGAIVKVNQENTEAGIESSHKQMETEIKTCLEEVKATDLEQTKKK
jgi:hypothetical protein